jgi:hypothetical protein
MSRLLDILHHTVYTTRLIPYVIILPTLSGFSFPYFHGYTPITEPRHICASVNMHCKTDIILIIVHSGLHGHGTFTGLIVFFFFSLFQGHFIVFICCLLVPLLWDIVLCFCMALRSKRTGETVDDTSGTEHARYFGIYHV